MFRLQVNGTIREIKTPSVEAVLEAEALPRNDWGGLAVARNGHVIPRAEWNTTTFAENDRIDIVRAFAGG